MKNPKLLPIVLGVILAVLLITAGLFLSKQGNLSSLLSSIPFPKTSSPSPTPTGTPSVASTTAPEATSTVSPTSTAPAPTGTAPATTQTTAALDLSVDQNGLSKSTVVMNTTQGTIKFKFYPQDAPNTVNRFAELIRQNFYNGLTFHRVVPGFVIQGGDPVGNGTGGSGQKLKAEFNNRRHVEGTVAMARAQDPDSADSQFYISLGTHPHLDRNYTIFGQVIEGMDVAKKIKVGDKITTATIQ